MKNNSIFRSIIKSILDSLSNPKRLKHKKLLLKSITKKRHFTFTIEIKDIGVPKNEAKLIDK